MPNTLAHLGVQGLFTRLFLTQADLKWLYVGCILPDLPWIMQRAIRAVYSAIERYDLLLYSSVQSSLFFCLILALSLALMTRRPGSTFLVLGLSCFFHLLLDATQIKWANGVLLFAPISWQLTSFNLYWPEALPTFVLTVFGLCYFLVMWRKACSPVEWAFPGHRLAIAASIVLIAVYLIAPPAFIKGPRMLDNYYVTTLEDQNGRIGKAIAFDRAFLEIEGEQARVRNFNNEWFYLEGIDKETTTSLISLKGRFLSQDRIKISEYHLHPLKARALSSIIGLALVLVLWICVLIRPFGQLFHLPKNEGFPPGRSSSS